MKLELRNDKGITLVALVVTIVVLLILAGISLNLVLGENGIIAKAKDAKEKSEQDASNTDMALQGLESEMLEQLGESSVGNGGTGELPAQVNVGVKATSNSTINGQAASATNPIIPEGYYAINVGEATWDGEGGPLYNKGLAITDSVDASGNSNGNEWVWVPVADASVMYEIANPAVALSGSPSTTDNSTGNTTGNTVSTPALAEDVTTAKYSKSEIISGITRVSPDATSRYKYSEPNIVTNYDNDSNAQTAGFNSLADMAENIVNDYETMIASIEKYHGFYIGRYELTENGEKAGTPLSNSNWHQLYANCKSLATSDKAITRMIWGCQWDITCNWLISSGAKTSDEVLTDSTSWGNYATRYGSSDDVGNIEDTGSSTEYMANNIYDLAGNCCEYTQEAWNALNRRACRGPNMIVSSINPSIAIRADGPTFGGWRYSRHFDCATMSEWSV